jgi:hypothetical protein
VVHHYARFGPIAARENVLLTYGLLDSPIARFFNEHAIIEDTLYPAVLNKMNLWLKDCDEKHSKCAYLKTRTTPLLTRLLDLTSLPARQDMIDA